MRRSRAAGAVDILVNNAGVFDQIGSTLRFEPAAWDHDVQVNLSGPFYATRAVLPGMLERRWGRIVNISSMSSRGAYKQPSYGATKEGLIGLTKTVALEFAAAGITANAVLPGLIATPKALAAPDDIMRAAVDAIPAGRLGTPEEVGDLVAFLASDAAGVRERCRDHGRRRDHAAAAEVRRGSRRCGDGATEVVRARERELLRSRRVGALLRGDARSRTRVGVPSRRTCRTVPGSGCRAHRCSGRARSSPTAGVCAARPSTCSAGSRRPRAASPTRRSRTSVSARCSSRSRISTTIATRLDGAGLLVNRRTYRDDHDRGARRRHDAGSRGAPPSSSSAAPRPPPTSACG